MRWWITFDTLDAMSNVTLRELHRVVDELWPEHTAQPWDQVGIVTGADDAPVRRVLLAVDAVDHTVHEALAAEADALVTHHPLLLRGVHTVAERTGKGSLLATLIRGNCALIAAHTNADAPAGGVSDVLAQAFGLASSLPIEPGALPDAGIGRIGELDAAVSLSDFAARVAAVLPATAGGVRVAGDPGRLVRRVALCGGAGDSLLDHEAVRAADVYVTSDLRHHPAQDSLEQSRISGGPALIDISHWAAESLWLTNAAQQLRAALPTVEFVVSTRNTDPWSFLVPSAGADPIGLQP